jgi:hypothetical protein
MQFAEDFSCITGGYVNSVPRGSTEEMDMSTFGVELVYVNVGLLEKYCSERYGVEYEQKLAELSSAIGDRLEEEGGAEASTTMVRLQHTFMSARRIRISYPSTFR